MSALSKAEFDGPSNYATERYRETIRLLHAWALAAQAMSKASGWGGHVERKRLEEARNALPKDWWEGE